MENKQKIAFIITRLCSGGAVEAIKNLAIGLDSNRFEITLFHGQLDKSEIDASSQLNNVFHEMVELKHCYRSFSILKDHFATNEIQAHLRQGNFDIVHTHTSKAGFIGRLAAHREKVPCIIHSTHGSIFGQGAEIPGVSGIKKKIFLMAERKAADWCHKILTLSQSEIRNWQSLGVGHESQFICLPSPVNVKEILKNRQRRDELRREWKVAEGKKIILQVGRLALEKGHRYMLDVMSRGIDAQLWIVGEGPERAQIESMINEIYDTQNTV